MKSEYCNSGTNTHGLFWRISRLNFFEFMKLLLNSINTLPLWIQRISLSITLKNPEIMFLKKFV